MKVPKGKWDMGREIRKVDATVDAPSLTYQFSGGRKFYDAPRSEYYQKKRRRRDGQTSQKETEAQSSENPTVDAGVSVGTE